MTPEQQFIVEILKIVAPAFVAFMYGWHKNPPSYMKKKLDENNEGK